MPNNTTLRYLPPLNFDDNEACIYQVYVLAVIAIAAAVLSPVAVVKNALVLTAIWRNLTLRTTSYIVLAGLAFTDFGTGLISQPFWIVKEVINLKNSQLNSTH